MSASSVKTVKTSNSNYRRGLDETESFIDVQSLPAPVVHSVPRKNKKPRRVVPNHGDFNGRTKSWPTSWFVAVDTPSTEKQRLYVHQQNYPTKPSLATINHPAALGPIPEQGSDNICHVSPSRRVSDDVSRVPEQQRSHQQPPSQKKSKFLIRKEPLVSAPSAPCSPPPRKAAAPEPNFRRQARLDTPDAAALQYPQGVASTTTPGTQSMSGSSRNLGNSRHENDKVTNPLQGCDREQSSTSFLSLSMEESDLLEEQRQERVNGEAAQRVEQMIVKARIAPELRPESNNCSSLSGDSGLTPFSIKDAEKRKFPTNLVKGVLLPVLCLLLVALAASCGTFVALQLTRTNSNDVIKNSILISHASPTLTPSASQQPSSNSPSSQPSFQPTFQPTFQPSNTPTEHPSSAPLAPTALPTTAARLQIEEVALSISAMERLWDQSSAQNAALRWLSEEDSLFPTLSRDEQLERFVLVTLYFATKGRTSWIRQGRFLSSQFHVCDWNENTGEDLYGVFCRGQQVMLLDLSETGLAGSLPPELGHLTGLQVLDLSRNAIEGTLPFSALEGLESLEVFSVYQNAFSGTIGPSVGRLSPHSLTRFDVSENMLEGTLPTEFGLLTSLEYAELSVNRNLHGIIPSEIGRLGRLRKANFGFNRFEGSLPMELANCSSLDAIGFYSNALSSTLNQTLAALPSSTASMYLAFNNLTGSLPSTVSRFSRLTELNLRSTGVSGPIPTEMGLLTRMEEADFSSNQLTGTLPSELGALSGALRLWNVGINNLSGSLPSELSLLTQLQHLDLSENQFTGVPGNAVGSMQSLQTIILQGNDWTRVNSICNGNVAPNVNANSCEAPNRFPCSCCNFCCISPPFVQRDCPLFKDST